MHTGGFRGEGHMAADLDPVWMEHVLTGFFRLQAQKFIEAYSAFLKRQGKLPIPGS